MANVYRLTVYDNDKRHDNIILRQFSQWSDVARSLSFKMFLYKV